MRNAKISKDELIAEAIELGLAKAPSYLKQKKSIKEIKSMIKVEKARRAKELEEAEGEEVIIEKETEDIISEDKAITETSPVTEEETFVEEDKPTEKEVIVKDDKRDPRCMKCKYSRTYGKGVCRSCRLFKK